MSTGSVNRTSFFAVGALSCRRRVCVTCHKGQSQTPAGNTLHEKQVKWKHGGRNEDRLAVVERDRFRHPRLASRVVDGRKSTPTPFLRFPPDRLIAAPRRPLIPAFAVVASYGVAIAYVSADAVAKGFKCAKESDSK